MNSITSLDLKKKLCSLVNLINDHKCKKNHQFQVVKFLYADAYKQKL